MAARRAGGRKSLFLKQLFLSYVLLLVPAFFVFTACTSHLFMRQQQMVAAAAQTELDRIAMQLAAELRDMETQSLYLSLKEEMQASKLRQNGSAALSVIQWLENIRYSNERINDAFVYLGGDVVYGANGASRLSTLTQRQLQLDSDNAQRLLLCLKESGHSQIVLLASGQGCYLLFHVSIPGGSEPDLSVNYLMRYDTLARQFTGLMQAYACAVQLMAEDETAVQFSLTEGGALQMGAMAEFPGQAWTAMKAQSAPAGLVVRAQFPTGQLYASVNNSRAAIFALLAVVLFLAVAAAFAFSQRNSLSIRQIALSAAPAQMLPGKSRGWMDEIGVIRNMLALSASENLRMQGAIRAARRHLLRQTLLLLFHGVTMEPGMVQETLRMNGLELHETCFAVALCCAPEGSGEEWMEALASLPSCELSCETGVQTLAVLVQLPTLDTGRTERHAFAQKLAGECRQAVLAPPFIAMSRPCEALEQVYQAYMEAMLARRGPWFQRQGLILFDELISFEMPSLCFEPETVQEFRQAMQNLETKAVEKSARKLLAQIDARSNEDENDQEAAILMRSHLVQLVLNHLTQLGMEREYFAQLYALDPQKGGDFAQQLLFLLKRACAAGQATDELYAAAVAFVQEHYTDQNLSLEDVAQAIGQNKTYVSRMFRLHSGRRYIDYLSDLRLNRAAELLAHSDLQIREITHLVGYWDSVSFQKKFRAAFGVNPSEYRRAQEKDGGKNHAAED